MKTYDFDRVLFRLQQGPAQAIRQWEDDYYAQIRAVAEFVRQNKEKSPVVLLAGPSASSKTSTAQRIALQLQQMGIGAHLLSMDNYFLSRDTANFPTLPDGRPDLESPECLDMALLDQHFSILEQGGEIYVPTYDFATKCRAPGQGRRVDGAPGDVYIFEGIHALNQRFTGRHPDAARIYVSPEACFVRSGAPFCTPVQLRLMRRVVRDSQFRSASAAYSLSLWENVLAGEAKHILPYRDSAHQVVTTALPYELGVLKRFIEPLFADLPADTPCLDQAESILAMLRHVPRLSPALVPEDSILREFIGPRPAQATKQEG